MKRMVQWFQGLKLNIKFTVIIIMFLMVSMAVLAGILFYNMEQNVINQQKASMEYNMEKNQGQVLKNLDAINMSTQFFLNDTGLLQFLNGVKTGESIATEEMLDFYNRDIASLERMVNNNPYLYQVRVYVDSENMQEMMPVLFRQSRMEKLAWAADESLEGWKFDYVDNLFAENGLTQQKKIMSLVTEITDFDNGKIGTLEVAMDMETMFPGLYEQQEGMFSCFIDENGTRYMGSNEPKQAEEYIDAALEKAGSEEKSAVYYSKVGKEKLVIGRLPLKELNGTLICVYNITDEIQTVYHLRTVYIISMILLLIVLAFVINWVVRGVLHKFYDILHSIRKIQKGDLDVVIEDCGTDEMGELGRQINKMMEHIHILIEENINRELLVKNSEIRALQNQINAHFIYNVLESIKMMAEIEEKYEISDAITSLGKLLRYSMKWVSGNVTVREEVEYIRNYLALINLRFDYEIFLSINIPEEVMIQEIPKMSLQPIVENAIYHGIEELAEDTTIYIKGIVQGTDCVIEITDSGKGMTEKQVRELYSKISGEIEASGGKGNGIGLKNVQDRIHINFGTKYGIEIASKLGCYTKIMVKIPMKYSERSEAEA